MENKITVPRASLNIFASPRLEQRFDIALQQRLISFNAPAGYGKTTALKKLRTHAESKGLRVSWVNIDEQGNDLTYLCSCVISALQTTKLSLVQPIQAQMGKSDVPAVETILHALWRELTQTDDVLALFLDDYHLIVDHSVHSAIEWLIERTPPNVKFVLASRVPLPFNLSWVYISGCEFTAEDLSLDLKETSLLVESISGKNIASSQIEVLRERTEGWAAGIQIAALALRNVSDVPGFIDQFSGTDRDIAVYLSEAVLSHLPSSITEFMMHTALFDRFSVEFCRDILSENAAEQLIESIKSRSLFLVSLDSEKKWYRYHHLLTDFMRNKFMLSDPVTAMDLRRAASAWFDRSGFMRETVHYAIAGRDFCRAVDLISRLAHELALLRGEHATMLDWVAALPRTHVAHCPEIQLPCVWSLMLTCRYSEAEAELVCLEKAIEVAGVMVSSKNQSASTSELTKRVTMMRCAFYALTGNTPLAAIKSTEWLSRWQSESDPVDVGVVLSAQGYSSYITQNYDGSTRSILASKEQFERGASYYGIAWAETLHALVLQERGRIGEAERVLVNAYDIVSKQLGQHSHGASVIRMLHAQICYEQNRVDEAEQILNEVFLFANSDGFGEGSLAAYLTKARILFLRGRSDEADTCLVHGASAAERVGLHRMAFVLNAERIHLCLKNNLFEKAFQIAASLGYSGEDIHTKFHRNRSDTEIEIRIIELRLLLATGKRKRALHILIVLLSEARRQGRNTWVVRLLCIKASMHDRNGEQDEALRLACEALSIGAVGEMCRTLIDESAAIGDLIQKITDRRKLAESNQHLYPSIEYLVRILHACRQTPTQATDMVARNVVSRHELAALSKREMQILELIDVGFRNQDVAKQLFVSESTIKWHLRNVYVKLKVNNRMSAVAKFRELSLLKSAAVKRYYSRSSRCSWHS